MDAKGKGQRAKGMSLTESQDLMDASGCFTVSPEAHPNIS
jgi:hypothetical protein